MPAGKPRKWESVEELQEQIDKYFNSCIAPALDKNGNEIYDNNGKQVFINTRPFTISGLALSLDTNRQTLINYQKEKGYEQYFDTIMRAKAKCENYVEERLFDKDGCNGAKFNLINNYAGWKEKSEHDTTLHTEFNVKLTDD